MARTVEVDILIDESGLFLDDRTDDAASVAGPSQIAGYVAPAGHARQHAPVLVETSLRAAPELVGAHSHREMSSASLERVVPALLAEMERRAFVPVRLVNAQRLGFGERASTYVSLVAELVLRVLRELQREHGAVAFNVHLKAARWTND